ncbi:MAG: exodeoxyribonuclease VII large subunit [Clostridiales bacterium]|nr:exodeoxyribonuclease VII large subunit [Clostridiales bacterium]
MRFPGPLTVTELNQFIKDLIDVNPPLSDIYIKGEISNFKAHSSGHFYFTLKDADSALKSVMFRSSAQKMEFMPENGMKVIAHGRISAFVRDGAYQLYADSMEPDGVGALYIAFEQLKRKLESEGLFADERKKPLPKIPSVVGIVTSPTGAAVRDIIHICRRRFPYAKLVLYPALVQGPDAPASVAAGIAYFNDTNSADVLIVGRGGGSVEDLWAFNTELVARAAAASKIPLISAVGHETDFTICDFVADRRAPTPSAAAEIAVPDTEELKQKFLNIISRERAVLGRTLEGYRQRLLRSSTSRVLLSPMNTIEDRRMAVLSLTQRMDPAIQRELEKRQGELAAASGKLSALNPMAVLTRGFCAAFNGEGKIIKSVDHIRIGDEIAIQMADGAAQAKVHSVRPSEKKV